MVTFGNIKKLLNIALIGLLITSCGVQKVVVKEEVHHIYKDSTVVNVKDSINVIPVERYVDIVPEYDTLRLETSLAEAKAFIDTSKHTLKGEIKNKKEFQQKTHIEYVYVEQRDTTYIKEPVPYPEPQPYIPKFYKFCLFWFIATLAGIAAFIYIKFFIK